MLAKVKMEINPSSLAAVFDGWNGYQHSILTAVTPLTCDQLAWRPAPHLRSVGELVRHLALGRLTWFFRIDPPGGHELAGQITDWFVDPDGNRHVHEEIFAITEDAGELVRWLEVSWQLIDATLKAWTVADLQQTYQHVYRGDAYIISYQWTVSRILFHDIHHGGELALLLGMQGLHPFELGDLGGHINAPPLADRG